MPGCSKPDSRVLVLQLARLGDFLQTTPLLAALKAQAPACLKVMVQPAQAPLAWASGLVDEVTVFDPASTQSLMQQPDVAWPLKKANLDGQLLHLREIEADIAYNLNFSHLAALAMRRSRISMERGWRLGRENRLAGESWMAFVMGMAGARKMSRMHLCDILASYADPNGPPLRQLAHKLLRAAQARAEELLNSLSGPLVALQLGANSPLRCWPLGSFAALARQLMEQGVNIVILGNQHEEALASQFLQHMGNRLQVLNLAGGTDIPTLAAVLARCDLLVSGDTGTLHLASAVGTTCLALFMGPAQVHETGPYGDSHLTLQARHTCQPCVEDNPACKGQAPCRYFINPDSVIRASLGLLQKQKLQTLASLLGLSREVEAYQGQWDGFGLTYQPLHKPLNASLENALALALREAGRVLQRGAYGTDMDALEHELRRSYRQPDPEIQEQLTPYMEELFLIADQPGDMALENISQPLRPLLIGQPERRRPACRSAAAVLRLIQQIQL